MRERLRRLRRENPPRGPSGPAAVPADRAGDGLPAWFRARSQRGAPSEGPEGAVPELGFAVDDDPSLAPKTVGEPERLAVEAASCGACAARTETFGPDHRHGDWRLDEVGAVDVETLALVGRDASLAGLDPRSAVYLDIETTGLSGGVGTVPFLVGLGSFTDDGLELWQGFVRSPEEEPAMLERAAERIRQSSGVVTFFGKSFDRHRLEDKMRMYGIAPPFDDRPHLDLYHVCHRLYARACADGRLNTMETVLCGVERHDDLSGAFAPAAWFDYLAERAHRLEAVFRHNKDDVLSLITLCAHVGRASHETRGSGAALAGTACTRAAGLARLCVANKDRERALAWFDRALERGAEPRRELVLERARLLRALGRGDEARAALQGFVDDPESDRSAYEAWLLLAMLEEHARKDLAAALVATLRAEAHVRHAGLKAPAELAKRRARLERKLSGTSRPSPRAD